MKSKILCVILGESELIKCISFWNCGGREKLSVVITSLCNTSVKSVYFWRSIKKWNSSTQSTVHCLQSQLVVALGIGISLFLFFS